MARAYSLVGGLSFALCVACGDDAGSSSGGGGSGGATSAATSSTSARSAKSTGAGGDDPGPEPCVLAEAEDLTGQAAVTITSEGINYEPRCVRVAAGTAVTFVSPFQMHPLRGGEVVDGQGVVDPASPITPQNSGTEATFTLDEVGDVPYFCSFHASIGMFGTIWVE